MTRPTGSAEILAASSPAVLRRWISLELRRLRIAAGKSRPDAADRVRASRATIGHMETARNLPTAAVLEILLGFYGVPDRLDFFLDLIDAARRGKNWWEGLESEVPDWFNLYLGLEAGAAEVSVFDAYLIPGLLQTPRYAEAVMRANPELTAEQLERRLALRMGRQQVLEREPDPMHYWTIVDESALYRRRGTPEVMVEQLTHLLKMADRPRIDLQVLPLTVGAHVAQQGSFQIFRFPEEMVGDPGLVYLELFVEGRYYDEPEEVALYDRAMTRLRVQAATPEDSKVLIERAIRKAHDD